jgi:uncharacterized protein (TIGR03067 family)
VGQGSASAGRANQIPWQLVDLQSNGESKPAEEIEGLKLVIQGEYLWIVKPTGSDPKLKFTANREQNTFDLTVQEGRDTGKTVLGIYAFHEGRLMLCINIFGDPHHRPSEFKTYDGDGLGFATLKRIAAE